jgi:hypothetical protein
MNFSRFVVASVRSACLFLLLSSGTNLLGLGALFQPTPDFSFFFSGKLRPETFFADGFTWLNKREQDRVYYSRHTLDTTLDTFYGLETYGFNVAEMKATLRNRSVWGDPSSVAPVTPATLQDLDAGVGAHSHFLPRNILWMREIWLSFEIGTAFGLTFKNRQWFTIGAFPFMVGRGISLGEAYAVGPSALGFYTDFNIDQFAYGAKFDGDIVKDILHYDFYVAILSNMANKISHCNAPIYAQCLDRKENPERGFGNVNFVVATRFNWCVFKHDALGQLNLEPYALYNHDPEQEIEFSADADSKLCTVGFSGEYEGPRAAFGFDTAMNFGRQRVLPWDRNQVTKQLRNGVGMLVNSHVFVGYDPATDTVTNTDVYKAPFSPRNVVDPAGQPSDVGKEAQKLIKDNDKRCEFYNGRSIGRVPGFSEDMAFVPDPIIPVQLDELFNANDRFRCGYNNKYKGWMFVADGALFFCNKQIQLAATAGKASGDLDPNTELIDGDFAGFISLQEIYNGKRVRSAFLLSGAGKVQIPLSPSLTVGKAGNFAKLTSGFTNIIFWGAALHYTPKQVKRRIVFNPNMYMYWLDVAGNKFDPIAKKDTDIPARKFLGTEMNLFFDYYMFKDMKLYYVSSIFVPGTYFTDIKGKPFNKRQQDKLNAATIKSCKDTCIPNIGDNAAFTINIGIEYRF